MVTDELQTFCVTCNLVYTLKELSREFYYNDGESYILMTCSYECPYCGANKAWIKTFYIDLKTGLIQPAVSS